MSSHTIFFTLTLAFFAAACAKKTPHLEEPAQAAARNTPQSAESSTEARTTAEAVTAIAENLKRVHFGFNSDQLTEDSRAALAENARILKAHPSIMIEVQGHADIRGTTEYNLTLGDRRAEAVRKYLVRLGVSQARVRTLSYGEELPLVSGDGEIAWAQNRRAEFRVTAHGDLSTIRGSTN